MLTSRTILLHVNRKFSDSSGFLKAEFLCNDDTRSKCIEQMKTACRHTTIKLHPSVKMAAVLVPIVKCDKQNDELSLLYTLRSNKMRKHISQVSFPGRKGHGIKFIDAISHERYIELHSYFYACKLTGGILEECDSSYIDCALRETEEEIGISRDRVTLWGQTSLVHLRTAPAIMPVIGMIQDYRSDLLKINSQEVERVFTVPISELCRNKKHTQFRMIPRNIRDSSGTGSTLTAAYSIPVYTVDEARIWGITAIITHLFLQSLLPPDLYIRKIPYISKYK